MPIIDVRSDREIYHAILGSVARVPTNNVDQESPNEGSRSESGRESDLACELEVCCSSDGWNVGAHRNVTTLVTCVYTSQLRTLDMQNLCLLPGKPSSCCSGPRIRPNACAQIRSMKYPSPHKPQMYHWYRPKPLLSISLLINTHFFS